MEYLERSTMASNADRERPGSLKTRLMVAMLGICALVCGFSSSYLHFKAELTQSHTERKELKVYLEKSEQGHGSNHKPKLPAHHPVPRNYHVKALGIIGVIFFILFTLGLCLWRETRSTLLIILWFIILMGFMLTGLTD